MERKLTRLQIMQYCSKCNNVGNKDGQVVCSLTGKIAEFELDCEKFDSEKKPDEQENETTKTFWGSHKTAIILCIIGLLRFLIKLGSGKVDIWGILFLIIGIGWLIFAISDMNDQ